MRLCSVTIIPLAPASRPGSSDLPEGHHRPVNRSSPGESRTLARFGQRAGPALPSYLVLHHAGFAMPPSLLTERWALTPPFHPYLSGEPKKMSRRFSFELSPGSKRRRYSLCGTVRERVAQKSVVPLPWRYQAHCPSLLAQMRCPDFPPARSLARKSQRLSSPPAVTIITR